MATLQCSCGKVKISFRASAPITSVECCCCDCANATVYCQNIGGPPAPAPPTLLAYIDNDITNIEGEEHLETFQLRGTSASLRLKSTCCHTHLLASHFLYLGRRVVVLPDSGCDFAYPGDTVEPYCRLQTKFWNEKQHGPMPPLKEGMIEEKSDVPHWVTRCQVFQKVSLPALPPRQGESFQEIIKRIQVNKPLVVADMEETPLPGHFRTGLGMLSLTLKNPFAKDVAVVNDDAASETAKATSP